MQAWVESELASAQLGDGRRVARMKKLVDQLSQVPEGSFNEACASAADRKGAYRFFANEAIAPEAMLQAHYENSWQRIAYQLGAVLVVQDTTSIDYSTHRRATGLGPLETARKRGYSVHSALALSEQGAPLGLVHQHSWVRDPAELGKRANRRDRPWGEKESYKWQRTVEAVQEGRGQQQRFIIIGDRESDVYGLLASSRPAGVELLVRSAQNRKVQREEGFLHDVLGKGPAAGQVMVEVGRAQHRLARQAICEVRYRPVTLCPPGHADAGVPKVPVQIWAVAITELHPPNSEAPLQWILLASWPIESLEEAIQCASYYSKRWIVERYHFVLKSGCRIEAAQLRNWPRLHRLEAIYSIVAWRLLTLTYQARLHPESPCEPALSRDEWTVLYAQHNHRLPHPHEPAPTLGQVVMWIAQLGGYWGRKQDAPPGVKVLWRGLMRLSAMVEGFNLAFSLLPVETRCG